MQSMENSKVRHDSMGIQRGKRHVVCNVRFCFGEHAVAKGKSPPTRICAGGRVQSLLRLLHLGRRAPHNHARETRGRSQPGQALALGATEGRAVWVLGGRS